MGTDNAGGRDECVRALRRNHGADRRLFVWTDLGQRGEFAAAGSGRGFERHADRSDGGETSGANCIVDGAGDRAGDRMGWIEVDAADAGERRCDESVRTHRSGDRPKRRLFVYADFRNCRQRATADGCGRPERCAEHADGSRYTKSGGGADGSGSGAGIGVERNAMGAASVAGVR